LNSFQVDPRAESNISETSWNFGTVTQGTLLTKEIALANSGFTTLRAYAISDMANFEKPYLSITPGTYSTLTLTLDTGQFSPGTINTTVNVRTGDVNHPSYSIQINGTVVDLSEDALAQKADDSNPWDQLVFVPGPYDANDPITFDHTIQDSPNSIHPLYVYDQSGNELLGVGENGLDFTGETAPFGMFGDGRDGDLVISSNTTDSPIDSSCSGTADSNSLSAFNASFATGQKIMIHQSRGTDAGVWEINEIESYNEGTIITKDPLEHTYTDSGASQAQVIVLKQYHNVTINSGVTWTAKAWDGNV